MSNLRQHHVRYLKLSLLSLSIAAQHAYAEDPEFNTAFLKDVSDQVVFEAVTKGYSLIPGNYDFSIFLNDQRIDKRKIKFYQKGQEVVPCIDASFIDDYQILYEVDQSAQETSDSACYDLTALPGAKLNFDAGMQTLNLSIPQVFLRQNVRGYISPKLYDQGINALIVNYNANTSLYKAQSGKEFSNSSLLLNSGINWGAWRYRNQSSFIKSSGYSAEWDSAVNKIERDIIPLKARIELGDANTRSDVFDSINFRGVQFSSDDAQLPIGLQNYAPVIRGTARSNALVEIRQNNYLVYSMNVAPGNFEIKDLYAANDSGDLEIKVIESDGSVRTFTQPYASVPNMIRAGQKKYQVTAGQYRSGSDDYQPYFGQLTYTLGLNNYLTPYAGILAAEDYYSAAGGVAWSAGQFGALSADLSFANNTLSNGRQEDGLGVRLLYAKSIQSLGTDIHLAGYHYTARYYGFSDAVQEKAQWRNGVYEYNDQDPSAVNDPAVSAEAQTRSYYSTVFYNKKNQYQISLNQRLGKWGQLYANLSDTQFWQKDYNQRNWQIGYNNNIQRLSYGVYYQNSKSLFAGSDYSIGLNFSFPLDQLKPFKKHDVTSNNNYQYSGDDGAMVQSALTANFLKDKNLQTQLQVSHSEKSGDSLNLNAAYQGTKGNSNIGYAYSDQYQQVYAGVNGGILMHEKGVIFGQQMNNSPILIEAKGASNIRIENQTGLKLDKNGYAIMSGSSPYAKNRVALQAEDLGQNIFIEDLVRNDIVPTKFAVVKVEFNVKTGHSVLVNLNYNGHELAAGTEISDVANLNRYGLVGLNSQAFLTNVESGQKMFAKWGSADTQQCSFILPELNSRNIGYDELTLACEAGE